MRATARDVILEHNEQQPKSFYFSESSMEFFGDSMDNYYLRANTVTAHGVECYVVARRKPVKGGLQGSALLAVDDYRMIWA
jgi:hypothetical protein